MMRAVITALAMFTSACSLIVDVDGVRASRDAGTTPPMPDAGGLPDATAEDAGTPDATAAPDAAGTPDAAPACARADVGFLSCTSRTFGSANKVALGGLDDGFVAVTAFGTRLEVTTVDSTGAELAHRGVDAHYVPISIAAAGAGAHWAVVFDTGSTRIGCFSDVDTATVTSTALEEVDDVAVAVSPQGGVAVIGAYINSISTEVYEGRTTGGCPTTLQRRSPSYYTRGVAAAHLTGGGAMDFRYGVSAVHPNLTDSTVAILDPASNMQRYVVYGGNEIRGLSSVISTDGARLVSAFEYFEQSGLISLTLVSQRVDLMTGGQVTDRVLSWNADAFDLSACGPNCVVTGFLSSEHGDRLTASFFADAASLNPQGELDVACDLPVAGADVDVAWSNDRVAFLYTDGIDATLYVCSR